MSSYLIYCVHRRHHHHYEWGIPQRVTFPHPAVPDHSTFDSVMQTRGYRVSDSKSQPRNNRPSTTKRARRVVAIAYASPEVCDAVQKNTCP